MISHCRNSVDELDSHLDQLGRVAPLDIPGHRFEERLQDGSFRADGYGCQKRPLPKILVANFRDRRVETSTQTILDGLDDHAFFLQGMRFWEVELDREEPDHRFVLVNSAVVVTSATGHRLSRNRRVLDFLNRENFDHVTFLDVVVVSETNAALEALLDLGNVLFEPTQAAYLAIVDDDDVVT